MPVLFRARATAPAILLVVLTFVALLPAWAEDSGVSAQSGTCTGSSTGTASFCGGQACGSTQTATATTCIGQGAVQSCSNGGQLSIVPAGQACPVAGQAAAGCPANFLPPSLANGQLPSLGNGQLPSLGNGQMPSLGNGQLPSLSNGQLPSLGNGQMPSFANGQMPSLGNGQLPSLGNGQLPSLGNGQLPSFGNGQPPPLVNGQLPPLMNGLTPSFTGGQLSGLAGGQAANGLRQCSTGGALTPVLSSTAVSSSPDTNSATAPTSSPSLSGVTRTGAAFSDPSGATPPPSTAFANAPIFSASTNDTFNGWQRAIVTADVQAIDGTGAATAQQAASVDVPASSGCGGFGSGSITLVAGNQGQPLGVQFGGSCGSGTGAVALTLGQPATLCVTLAQYLIADAHGDGGNGFALVGMDGNPLPSVSPTANAASNAQVCGTASATGTYNVAVSVSSPSPANVPAAAPPSASSSSTGGAVSSYATDSPDVSLPFRYQMNGPA